MLVLAVVAAVAIVQVHGQCYLEDVAATCVVCWETPQSSGVTISRKCADGVAEVKWVAPLPAEIYDQKGYPVSYNLKILSSFFDIKYAKAKGIPYHVPHSNVHSCPKARGVCTPSISKSPGLSTHTPNTPANFSVDGNHLQVTFNTSVALEATDGTPTSYTVIAHSRIFVPETKQPTDAKCYPNCLIKYDLAVGIPTSVVPIPPVVSSDAYISCGIAGATILLFTGSIIYAARTGRLSIETILNAVTREDICLVSEVIITVGDIVAFTMGVQSDVVESDLQDLQNVMPVCIFFVVTGWLSAVWNAKGALVSLYELIKHYQNNKSKEGTKWSKNHRQVWLRKLSAGDRSAQKISEDDISLVASSNDVEHLKTFDVFTKAHRHMRSQYSGLVTLFLGDIPMTVVGMYVVLKAENVEFAVIIALVTSSLLLGKKGSALARFKVQAVELTKAQMAVRELVNKDLQGTLTKIRISQSPGNSPTKQQSDSKWDCWDPESVSAEPAALGAQGSQL